MARGPISRGFILAGVCLVAIAPFFWWGSPSGHDFEFHMFSWMEVLAQWKHGIVYPRWAAMAHWGYGEARFLFYPPASWTIGAALGAVLPWRMVPGAYCWIALALAGAAMYRFARQWLSVSDALFAAGFYALNPYHLLIVYWRSANAELLAAALLPLLPLFLLRLKLLRPSESGLRPTLCLSLTLAAAWLTNGPAAIMVQYSTAGLAVVIALATAAKSIETRGAREQWWGPRNRRFLLHTATAMVMGAGLASFYLVPAIYEQRWIDLNQLLSPGVRPQDNFLFTPTADPDHNRFNLLVSSMALAEIGVLAFAIWSSHWRMGIRTKTSNLEVGVAGDSVAAEAKQWQRPRMLLSAWGTGCAFLMLSVSDLLWRHLPKFRFVQLPFRWLLCMNAAMTVLLTMAAKRWSSRCLICIFLLGALILAGYRFQPPWWERASDIRDMSDSIANGPGYEGTDEYVPAGDDAYELNHGLPRVSDDEGGPIPNKILSWEPTEKHFTVHAADVEDIVVRLFSYPSWEVVVNGKPTATEKTEVTGLIVIPIAAGDSDVRIYFRRTDDCVVGDVVSLISLAVFVLAWLGSARKKTCLRTTQAALETSPIA